MAAARIFLFVLSPLFFPYEFFFYPAPCDLGVDVCRVFLLPIPFAPRHRSVFSTTIARPARPDPFRSSLSAFVEPTLRPPTYWQVPPAVAVAETTHSQQGSRPIATSIIVHGHFRYHRSRTSFGLGIPSSCPCSTSERRSSLVAESNEPRLCSQPGLWSQWRRKEEAQLRWRHGRQPWQPRW